MSPTRKCCSLPRHALAVFKWQSWRPVHTPAIMKVLLFSVLLLLLCSAQGEEKLLDMLSHKIVVLFCRLALDPKIHTWCLVFGLMVFLCGGQCSLSNATPVMERTTKLVRRRPTAPFFQDTAGPTRRVRRTCAFFKGCCPTLRMEKRYNNTDVSVFLHRWCVFSYLWDFLRRGLLHNLLHHRSLLDRTASPFPFNKIKMNIWLSLKFS